MIRRVILLVMALALFVGAAAAESDPYQTVWEAMYRIVLRTAEEDVTLGSGVLFGGRNILLTAECCCVDGDLYAVGEDGEHAILGWELLENTGAALMEMDADSPAKPLTLANYDLQSLPYVFGADAEGNVGAAPLFNILQAMYREKKALQLSSSEGLLPGAVVADERGQIVGLVVAQQMEGVGMYTALEPDILYGAIAGDAAANAFLPVEAGWSNGLLTFKWKDRTRDGGVYLLTLSGAENSYYTSYETTEKSFQLAVPAGHTYYYQVQWAESAMQAQPLNWSAMEAYTVPETAFTQFGLRQECYLASAPKGQTVADVLPEMTFISADTLLDGGNALYLQVINTYAVSAEVQTSMTVSLVGPDGQFYFEEMLYSFAPERGQRDVFAVPVDDLFAACRDFSGWGSLPAGDYVLKVSIAGKAAGEYAFTIQPAGTAAPAPTVPPVPAETGFVDGLSVTREKGQIIVDWADCAIPEGKNVTAYILYDGNTFYSFKETIQGTTSVDFPSIPGVDCMVWAAYGPQGNPNLVPSTPQQCVVLNAPEKSPFTLHGFANVRMGVAVSDDASAADKGAYLPEAPLTRDVLKGEGFIYFQTEDTYSVTGESADHVLTIVLHTPEGMHFMTAGGYTFSPEFNASDLWLLDITALFDDYTALVHTEPWPAGDYIVGYYIDGQVVNEMTFTLE